MLVLTTEGEFSQVSVWPAAFPWSLHIRGTCARTCFLGYTLASVFPEGGTSMFARYCLGLRLDDPIGFLLHSVRENCERWSLQGRFRHGTQSA